MNVVSPDHFLIYNRQWLAYLDRYDVIRAALTSRTLTEKFLVPCRNELAAMTLILQQDITLTRKRLDDLTTQNRLLIHRLANDKALISSYQRSQRLREAHVDTIEARLHQMTIEASEAQQENAYLRRELLKAAEKLVNSDTCLCWEMRLRMDLHRRAVRAQILPEGWPDMLRPLQV